MNKKIFILIASIVIIVAGFWSVNNISSFKAVSIDIKRPGIAATVFNDKSEVAKEIPEGAGVTSIRLRPGNYTVVPKGDNIADRPLMLVVTGTGGSLEVDPGYSKEYLQTLLDKEGVAIRTLLTETYAGVIDAFTINPGSLYGYGDWYGTTLIEQSPGAGSNGDVYRTILRKQDGVWKIVATPAIVLSAREHPSVPRSILDTVNADLGY